MTLADILRNWGDVEDLQAARMLIRISPRTVNELDQEGNSPLYLLWKRLMRIRFRSHCIKDFEFLIHEMIDNNVNIAALRNETEPMVSILSFIDHRILDRSISSLRIKRHWINMALLFTERGVSLLGISPRLRQTILKRYERELDEIRSLRNFLEQNKNYSYDLMNVIASFVCPRNVEMLNSMSPEIRSRKRKRK